VRGVTYERRYIKLDESNTVGKRLNIEKGNTGAGKSLLTVSKEKGAKKRSGGCEKKKNNDLQKRPHCREKTTPKDQGGSPLSSETKQEFL